jgi:putative CocE/NonD family hydrolase
MTKMFIQLNLTGSTSGIPTVSYYILGSNGIGSLGNIWDVSDTYPPRKSAPLELYLSAFETLEPSVSTLSGNFSYVYDPEDPVTTIGGNTYSSICGPQDQTPLYNRSDIISFTGEPFSDHLLICGRTSVVLYVSSNATDTDFTAKLVDVYPDGRNMLVQDGIIRMRWRDSLVTPTLMQNDTVYEVTIDLWSICYVFSFGHRMRLDISSSNFPRFSVNPNNGLMINETGPSFIAENTIYYGSEYPSRLIVTKPYDQTVPGSPVDGAASLMLNSLLIALVFVIHLKYQ